MSNSICVSASNRVVNPVFERLAAADAAHHAQQLVGGDGPWRGSEGVDHSAMAAGAFISSFPFRTRMPRSAFVTDLVIDQPISGVAGVTPGA